MLPQSGKAFEALCDVAGFTLKGRAGQETSGEANDRTAQEQAGVLKAGRKPIFAQPWAGKGTQRAAGNSTKQPSKPDSRPSRFSAPLFDKAVQNFAQQFSGQRDQQPPTGAPAPPVKAPDLTEPSRLEKAAQAFAAQFAEAPQQADAGKPGSARPSAARPASSSTAQEAAPEASMSAPLHDPEASKHFFFPTESARSARHSFGGKPFGAGSRGQSLSKGQQEGTSEQLRAKLSSFTFGIGPMQGKERSTLQCKLPQASQEAPRQPQQSDATQKSFLKRLAAVTIRTPKKGKLPSTIRLPPFGKDSPCGITLGEVTVNRSFRKLKKFEPLLCIVGKIQTAGKVKHQRPSAHPVSRRHLHMPGAPGQAKEAEVAEREGSPMDCSPYGSAETPFTAARAGGEASTT